MSLATEPMPSIEETLKKHPNEQKTLLDLARRSIQHGLQSCRSLVPVASDFPPSFNQPAATFVTLHKQGELRGCIGSLQAYRPLIEDVAANANAAAFRDSRFDPVHEAEINELDIEISLLTPAEPIEFSSEEDLLLQLVPGEDGVILEFDNHRGTFLPQVWDQLSKPEHFLQQLKKKAGLPSDWWHPDVKVSRYHCLKIGS